MKQALTIATLVLFDLVLSGGSPASAWTAETHVEIARQAATIAPPDLFRQIKRNEKAFVAGISATLAEKRSSRPRSGRELLTTLEADAEAAVAAIEAHRRFEEVTHLLGRLAIHAAEANNPLLHSADDPNEARYRTDYERYVSSAFPRFPVLFYGEGRDIRTPASLRLLLTSIQQRGRRYYDFIGQEYERIGKVDGVREFDDRSTAFGIGSIAFSHAVSDVAALYRYIWVTAGGADRRDLPLTRPPEAASKAKAARP